MYNIRKSGGTPDNYFGNTACSYDSNSGEKIKKHIYANSSPNAPLKISVVFKLCLSKKITSNQNNFLSPIRDPHNESVLACQAFIGVDYHL